MNIYQMHSEKNAELVKHVNKLLAESSLKQDSLINEIDKLKLGIEESSIRKYKVTNGQLIIRDVRPDFNELECLKLATLIYDECDRIGVKYSYALALIQAESRFNYKAISNVGARGLMQIMPSTFVSIARRYGYPYEEGDIYDLKKNIKIGILYIYILKQKYDRSELVSAGYNGGPKIAANYRLYMNGDNSAFIPPETMKYVGSVNKNYQKYRKILGE
jgi:soluble lytic murein transglycosylase